MIAGTPKRNITLALALTTALSGCSGDSAKSAMPPGLAIVETVNGQEVQQVLLDVLARERKLDLANAEQRARALTELTDYIVLEQAAAAASYSDDPMFAAEVEINRLQGMANATLGKFRSSAQVDDSVLKTEYQQQIALAGSSDYDFSQLLFDNEGDALKAAGDALTRPFNEVFDAWAKQAKQAKKFQHVRIAQLPEPLGKALSALKAGETFKVPVKTDFGWHVIHLSAISPFTPPTFDQLKDSIRETVMAQLSEQRLVKLRSEAKITVETPKAEMVAAPKDAAKPEQPAH